MRPVQARATSPSSPTDSVTSRRPGDAAEEALAVLGCAPRKTCRAWISRRVGKYFLEDLDIKGFPLKDVLVLISSSTGPDRTFLVGIDGGAGAGKTTFTDWFVRTIGAASRSVSIVHVDNFCRASSEREQREAVVADLDWRRLRDRVLVPLRTGESAHFQLYDWPEDRLKDWVTIEVGGVTIIDGITSMRRELSGHYDLRIWLSCRRGVRVSRLLRREDTSAAEIERWLPSEDHYIALHDPESRAHLVIDTTANVLSKDGQGWFVKQWTPPSGL